MVEREKKQVTRTLAVSVPLVRKLLHRGARSDLARILDKAYAVDIARLLAVLGSSERAQAFSILFDECKIDHVASVLSEMLPTDGLALLENLEPAEIAKLLS